MHGFPDMTAGSRVMRSRFIGREGSRAEEAAHSQSGWLVSEEIGIPERMPDLPVENFYHDGNRAALICEVFERQFHGTRHQAGAGAGRPRISASFSGAMLLPAGQQLKFTFSL